MSLFTALHPLAQRTTLMLLITAEGDQLRINVTPRANNDGKGEKTLYPLSILATPDELDNDFAEAVSIYEPSVLSVLDQARAASDANGSGGTPRALPAPAATKGKRGPKPKGQQPPEPPESEAGENPNAAPPIDPRQTSIPGIENETPGEAQASEADQPAVVAEPDSAASADDGALDIF